MTVDPSLIAAVIVSAMSTITAAAAIGIYRRVSGYMGMVEQHERILQGEDGYQDPGLVQQVREHRLVMRAEGYLNGGSHDKDS